MLGRVFSGIKKENLFHCKFCC